MNKRNPLPPQKMHHRVPPAPPPPKKKNVHADNLKTTTRLRDADDAADPDALNSTLSGVGVLSPPSWKNDKNVNTQNHNK